MKIDEEVRTLRAEVRSLQKQLDAKTEELENLESEIKRQCKDYIVCEDDCLDCPYRELDKIK